jgi:hypothetical protein
LRRTGRRRRVAATPGRQAYSEPPDPSRLLIRGPMPRGCPECELATPRQRPSAPRSQGGRLLAADGCASSLSNPACCFCGGGPRGVAVATFGLSLVWACSSAELRAVSGRISIHALEYSLTISPLCGSPPWSIFYRSDRKSDRRLCAASRWRTLLQVSAHNRRFCAQPRAQVRCCWRAFWRLAGGRAGPGHRAVLMDADGNHCRPCSVSAGLR